VTSHLSSCTDCQRRVRELSSGTQLGSRANTQDQLHPATGKRSGFDRSRTERDPAAAGSSPSPSDTLPAELVEHPDYELIRELGRGAMGVVYLVQNRLMGRQEAVKVMSRHLMERPSVLERFLREIRSVGKLRHPNVVTAYAATRVGQSIVYAMEYVEGIDLARLVKTKGPLPPANACYYVYQAALGLQHAHEQGIVHRDIKPGNLILSRSGDRSVVKILDFGLNKVTSDDGPDFSLTHQGQMLGTPDYIAPEQTLNAQSVDIRADIYSLGCTLYYLLSGGPPFRGNSLYEVLRAHHSIVAKPLDQLRAEVPAELARVVATMMAKDPQERFQTPAAAAQALAPFFRKTTVASPLQPEARPAALPIAAVQTAQIDRRKTSVRPETADVELVEASRVNAISRWIPLGTGIVLSLVLLNFAVMWLVPRARTNPTARAPISSAATVAVAERPQPSTDPSPPPQHPAASPPAPAARPERAASAETTTASQPKSGAPTDVIAIRPEAGSTSSSTTSPPAPPRPQPPRSSNAALAALTRGTPMPATATAATSRIEAALLKQQPKKPPYPLEKVLKKAHSYANQIVIPAGMYHIAHSPNDRSGGKRLILITERKIESVKESALGMSSSAASELEVEPRLADRLDKLDPDLRRDKVAILSLWFTRDATCVLVKVEILLRYVTGFKRGSAYPRGDVDYETLQVSPEKTENRKGRDEDWEEPGRMLHFANLYKRKVMAYKKMLLAHEHAQLNNVMSNLWANMMHNAAADAAQQRQLQRAISGR
jgi:serine/threonine protein kinase